MSENKKKTGMNRKPKECKMCGSQKGFVGRYHLDLCRRCFKQNAERLGFKKYD